jgi:hypothetical protein
LILLLGFRKAPEAATFSGSEAVVNFLFYRRDIHVRLVAIAGAPNTAIERQKIIVSSGHEFKLRAITESRGRLTTE